MENIYGSLFGPVKPVLWIDLVITLIGLVGLVLNGLLLYITLKRQGNHAIDSILMTLVAASDVLACVFVLMSVGGRRFLGLQLLTQGGFFCGMGSILFCAASATTLVFSALLASVRYLTFVHGMAVPNTGFSMFIFLLLGLLWGMFFIRGFTSEMTVVPSEIYCTLKFWGTTPASQAFGIISLTLLFPPVLLIPSLYALITRHYSRLVGNTQRTRTKMLLVILAYPLITLPEFILAFINRIPNLVRHSVPDGIVITLLFSVTILNSIFALGMHSESNLELLSIARSSLAKVSRLFSIPNLT